MTFKSLLLFFCVQFLFSIYTFSQESKNFHFLKHRGIPLYNHQNLHSNQAKEELDSVFSSLPDFGGKSSHPFLEPEKIHDYYINTEIIGEIWSNSTWNNILKYIYSYDENGYQNGKRTQSWNGNAWVDSLKYTYDHPSYDYIYTYQHWNGSEWINDYRYTYLYDSSYYYKGFIYEIGDSLSWINNQRTIFYRNSITNYTDSVLYQFWELGEWKDIEKEFHTTDYKGRDSIITTYYLNDTVWEKSYNSIYFYDINTPSYSTSYQYWGGTEWINYYRYSYFYDADYYFLGFSGETWNDTTSQWKNDYRYLYIYDLEHRKTEYKYQKSSDGITWENIWHYTYEYDLSGYKTRQLFQNWGTAWEDYRQYLYEYDSNGLLILEIDQVWLGSEWVNEYRFTSIWELVSGINELGIANNYQLYNNYPNPFNPSTIIRWQLPVRSQVTLKIYDVLGNEIVTLINEEKDAGAYQVEWNASNKSSAVYFYQLRVGKFVDTKKMILLR
jgi:hypothetical protein